MDTSSRLFVIFVLAAFVGYKTFVRPLGKALDFWTVVFFILVAAQGGVSRGLFGG